MMQSYTLRGGSILGSSCEREWSESTHDRQLPDWGIPVVVVASITLGALIHFWVEEPVRSFLCDSAPRNPQQGKLWGGGGYGSFDVATPEDEEQTSLLSKSNTEGALTMQMEMVNRFPSTIPSLNTTDETSRDAKRRMLK